VAAEIRRSRGALIRVAIGNGGKTIAEADPEVSEAIDFADFYGATAEYFEELPELSASPAGVVVVVPPWNFPIAIPCGGVAAALAAGNTVILKPASHTVLVAWELCQCFWRAGVSRRTLQFLPCPGSGAGARLVSDSRVNAVILTGGTSTALQMLRSRPDMRLFAETGGKNAMIVTALSDREQAVKHLVHSAFSHAGQKCSATSLLLLEAEVFDDPSFRRMLCDAVKSIHVGSAWALETRMTPLITPPAGELEQGLLTLEPSESWALMPQRIAANPALWSPGIKWNVQPGSFTHCTEFFGPLLGVMRFTHLDEAIELVNATGYGLTSGPQSLDEREIATWKNRIEAGNLYINKPTVGAIVLRQPFGGWGKSSFGPGLKAGGPNYVTQFMHVTDRGDCSELEISHPDLASLWEAAQIRAAGDHSLPHLRRALASYEHWWKTEFSREHDHFRLLGEDNIRRYIPFRVIRVRVGPLDTFFELFARVAAGRVTGARVIVSSATGNGSSLVQLLDDCTDSWAAGIEFIVESDEAVADSLARHSDERTRYAAPDRVPPFVRAAAAESGVWIADQPVLAAGRVELLWYIREKSISHAYHRYGNLGARAAEERSTPT
jgi:RHH-type proline utilization regulon transcriptional repressor/proline dehydrogenase/delta 1-pyrroline-5-carboxylate dehydrogenase